jgi:hypothetical protein
MGRMVLQAHEKTGSQAAHAAVQRFKYIALKVPVVPGRSKNSDHGQGGY